MLHTSVDIDEIYNVFLTMSNSIAVRVNCFQCLCLGSFSVFAKKIVLENVLMRILCLA